MTTPLSLPTGSWVMDDKRASGRRLVNCFSEIGPQTGSQDLKSTIPPAYLRRMFGISSYASVPVVSSFVLHAAEAASDHQQGYNNGTVPSGISTQVFGSITPTTVAIGGGTFNTFYTDPSTPTVLLVLVIGGLTGAPASFAFNYADDNLNAWNFTWDGTTFVAGGPFANTGVTIIPFDAGTGTWAVEVTYTRLSAQFPSLSPTVSYNFTITAGGAGGPTSIGTLPIRGLRTMGGITYVVIGATLYVLTNNGTMTAPARTGTLTPITSGITGSGFVRLCDNTKCLFILIPGTNQGYTYTVNNGLTQCLDETFLFFGAIDVWFIDSYMVFLALNGLEFYNDDGQTVSGTGPITFTTGGVFPREFGTDEFVGMCVDHRTVHMFGQLTTEGYVDVGNATESPFAAAPDAFMQIGVNQHCAYTIALQDQSVFWVANDLTVRRLNGQTPVRVSNSGVEALLEDNKFNLFGAYALTPTIGGHPLWILTIPLAQKTIAYDCLTTEWFDLSSITTADIEYWRPLCWYQAHGLQLVGDSQASQLGFLDEQTFTEWGAPMALEIATQSVYDNHNRITHERVEAVVTAGQGDITNGAIITLFKSDDAGYTWVAREGLQLGVQGSPRPARAVWWRLGQSRDRAYKFRISDPTQFFMVAIVAEVSGGKW